jgi:Fe-S cluster biogenesis protein NfuA
VTSENADTTIDGAADDAIESPDAAMALPAEIEVTDEVIAVRTEALADIISMLRPAVQMDGGDLELVEADYINGVIEVELQGACGSCAVSGATLTDGVERILKERLDWVTEVVGGVNEEIDELESAAMGRGAYVPKYY